MKKLLALFLVLFLVPSVSFSESSDHIISHYSITADFRPFVTGKDASPYEFDVLMFDIYFTDDPGVAYIWNCICIDDTFLASGFNSYSVVELDGLVYFADGKGAYITGWYDENGSDFWLNYRDNQFRLHSVPMFSFYEDWQ